MVSGVAEETVDDRLGVFRGCNTCFEDKSQTNEGILQVEMTCGMPLDFLHLFHSLILLIPHAGIFLCCLKQGFCMFREGTL